MTTSTDSAAARDLHGIRDGIAAEYSPQDARDAALTLRTAIVEGRIDGLSYDLGARLPDCGCVIGHICAALQRDPGRGLPHWSMTADLSEVELLTYSVYPGDRPNDTPELAELLRIVDTWLERQGEVVLA